MSDRQHHKVDEYRRQAAEAKRHAMQAERRVDRNAWLRLANGWICLIPPSARVPEDEIVVIEEEDTEGERIPLQPDDRQVD